MDARAEISNLIHALVKCFQAELASDGLNIEDKRRIEKTITYLNQKNADFTNGAMLPNLVIAFDHLGLLNFYMDKVKIRSLVEKIVDLTTKGKLIL